MIFPGRQETGKVNWLRPALGRPASLIAAGPQPKPGWFSPPVFLLPFLLANLFMETWKEVHYNKI
jgi:hypothetical protein